MIFTYLENNISCHEIVRIDNDSGAVHGSVLQRRTGLADSCHGIGRAIKRNEGLSAFDCDLLPIFTGTNLYNDSSGVT